MKRAWFSVCIAVPSLLLLVPAAPAGDPAPRSLRATLGEAEYRACGLDRLAPEELDRLGRHVIHPGGISYLEASADRFLERQGFRPVQILGLLRADDSPGNQDLLLVADGYDVYRLRLWGLDSPLSPGAYWAKNTLSSWNIMRPDGELQHFTAQSP